MSIRQEFISGIKLNGSNRKQLVKYLTTLKKNNSGERLDSNIINLIDDIIDSYNDLFDKSINEDIVVNNLVSQIGKIKPLIELSLQTAEIQNKNAIAGILANYKSIERHYPKSFLKNLTNSIHSAFVSPLDSNLKYKTRTELAADLKMSRKTLYNHMKNANISIKSGDISPEDQEKILKGLGFK